MEATNFRNKQKYYSKLAEKMARAEKRAMRKFEKKFLQYQLLKKRQVGKLEMEIQELKEQMKERKTITLGDLGISLDRVIFAAVLALIIIAIYLIMESVLFKYLKIH